MSLRSVEQYVEGLRDGRRVLYRGAQVKDVVEEPELRLAVDHSAFCYSIAHTHRELAVDVVDGEDFSGFWTVPRTVEDLQRRAALIEQVSALGAGTIVLKEVGSDALFGLLRAAEGEEQEKAKALHSRVRRDDVALAV